MIPIKENVSAITENLARCATAMCPEEPLKSLLSQPVF